MILNAISEYTVVFLCLFWITTIFHKNILYKTNRCHHGGGAWSGGPAVAPVNLALPRQIYVDNSALRAFWVVQASCRPMPIGFIILYKISNFYFLSGPPREPGKRSRIWSWSTVKRHFCHDCWRARDLYHLHCSGLLQVKDSCKNGND